MVDELSTTLATVQKGPGEKKDKKQDKNTSSYTSVQNWA